MSERLTDDETANAATAAALAEHAELNGHIEIAEQCRDYLAHEAADNGDPTGKLQDFESSLRVVLDQLDRQRRSRNWYEVAYTAGKQKLIESATENLRAQLATVRQQVDTMIEVNDELTRDNDELAEDNERLRDCLRVADKDRDQLLDSDPISLVREFHTAFSQPIANEPSIADPKLNELRINLIAEELCELAEALGFKLDIKFKARDLPTDEVEALDALVDLEYVLAGAYLSLGFHRYRAAALAEVHRSNMAKLVDGKPLYRDDGKVVKPQGWEGPDLAGVIGDDGRKGESNG